MMYKIATVWFLVVLVIGITLAEDDETVLRVVPPHSAVQPGEVIQLQCQHYPEDLEADINLDWYMPSGDGPISTLIANQSYVEQNGASILRFQSENGTLTIQNATFTDSGTYKCKDENHTLAIESIVKVFVMPSYTTEIIVVLVINAVLVVIFIACSVWTFFKDRKQEKIQKRKQKLGHHELAKRALVD